MPAFNKTLFINNTKRLLGYYYQFNKISKKAGKHYYINNIQQ